MHSLRLPIARPGARGIRLRDIERRIEGERVVYAHVEGEFDREIRACRVRIRGPAEAPPADIDALVEAGDAFWPLALARQIEDLVLHLRHNEPEIGTLVLASEGDLEAVAAHDAYLLAHRGHWLAREILLYWKRLLKRIDLDLAQPRRPGRAGKLLRRLPAGARARGGPRLHAGTGRSRTTARKPRCVSPSPTSAAFRASTV